MNRITWGALLWLASVVALLSLGKMRPETPADRNRAATGQLDRAIDFACRQTQVLEKPVLVSFEWPADSGESEASVPPRLGAALARFQLLGLPITEENTDFVRYFRADTPTWLVFWPTSCEAPIADWPLLARRDAPTLDSTAELEEVVSWLDEASERGGVSQRDEARVR